MAHKQMVPSVYASLRRDHKERTRIAQRVAAARWDGKSDPKRKEVAQAYNEINRYFQQVGAVQQTVSSNGVVKTEWTETERLVADAGIEIDQPAVTIIDIPQNATQDAMVAEIQRKHEEALAEHSDTLDWSKPYNELDASGKPHVISEDPFGSEVNCKCVLTDEAMAELKHEVALAKRRERDRARRAAQHAAQSMGK